VIICCSFSTLKTVYNIHKAISNDRIIINLVKLLGSIKFIADVKVGAF
jgi:hypothetical protein